MSPADIVSAGIAVGVRVERVVVLPGGDPVRLAVMAAGGEREPGAVKEARAARNGAAPVAPTRAAPSARLDPHSVALNLARQAADKRRSRQEPLTRRAALSEAPWFAALAESGCGEREWRAAYADRLIERGLALPSSEGRSGPSGPSGRAKNPAVLITGVSSERLARWDRAAERAGVSRSEWARAALDRAAG